VTKIEPRVDGRAAGEVTARTIEVAAGPSAVAVLRVGAGRPLLYLHGLCDVHSAWPGSEPTPFVAGLAERFDVAAPALPGYSGGAPVSALHDMEDYVFHLTDLLGGLGWEQVDVVGHSLGGWLAAELALRRPERVARLALLSPLGLHVAGVEVPPVFGALAPRGIGGFGESRRLLFADAEGEAALRVLPDGMAEADQLRWFTGLAGAARLGWKAPHFQSRRLAERLHRITVPTLLVVGEQDVLVPETAARAWVEGLAAADLFEVPDAGHCLTLEWPEGASEVAAYLWR